MARSGEALLEYRTKADSRPHSRVDSRKLYQTSSKHATPPKTKSSNSPKSSRFPPQCRIAGQSKISNQKLSRPHPPNHFDRARAGSLVNQKSKIKNRSIAPVHDRSSIKNQKSKIKNPLDSPPCRIGGQSQIKNQKPCRRHPPNHFADARVRSLVNLKSKIKNLKSFDRS